MRRKKTVAHLKPLQPVSKWCDYAQVTPSELAPHLGVSRQRASALLHARRIAGPKAFPRAPDGRWYVWLPLQVIPGSRGPKNGFLKAKEVNHA